MRTNICMECGGPLNTGAPTRVFPDVCDSCFYQGRDENSDGSGSAPKLTFEQIEHYLASHDKPWYVSAREGEWRVVYDICDTHSRILTGSSLVGVLADFVKYDLTTRSVKEFQ